MVLSAIKRIRERGKSQKDYSPEGGTMATTYIVLAVVIVVLGLYILLHIAHATYMDGRNHAGIYNYITGIKTAFSSKWYFCFDFTRMNFRDTPLCVALLAGGLGYVYSRYRLYKRYHYNSNGDGEWNDGVEFTETCTNPRFERNIIHASDLYQDMDNFAEVRNQNTMVIGGPGSRKTTSWAYPNIMQFNSSYVIVDPSGEIMRDLGHAFLVKGYEIKLFSTSNMNVSSQYNPFNYIHQDSDILKLVDVIVKNTSIQGSSQGDEFFAMAVKALYMAVFYGIFYFEPEEKHNMATVVEMLDWIKVDNKPGKSDKFDEFFQRIPDQRHIAVTSYKKFKQAADKTASSIQISSTVRLAAFSVRAVEDLTATDTIHLEELGDRKQVLFINIPAIDGTYSFISSMLFTQLFQELEYVAGTINPNSWLLTKDQCCVLKSSVFTNSKERNNQKKYIEALRKKYARYKIFEKKEGKGEYQHTVYAIKPSAKSLETLKVFQSRIAAEQYMDVMQTGDIHIGSGNRDGNTLVSPIHVIMDEFANIPPIPDFDKVLANMRKRLVAIAMLIQSQDQLKDTYKEAYAKLIANCYAVLFMGSSSPTDLEYMSKQIGEATQVMHNSSTSRNGVSESVQNAAYSMFSQSFGRRLQNKYCIALLMGQQPFWRKKYYYKEHPSAHLLFNPNTGENAFDAAVYFGIPEDQCLNAILKKIEEKKIAEKKATSPADKMPQQASYETDPYSTKKHLVDVANRRTDKAPDENPSSEDSLLAAMLGSLDTQSIISGAVWDGYACSNVVPYPPNDDDDVTEIIDCDEYQ